ncbi:MAG: 3-deoxy-7-phosphoheptulonate synthase [Deltaproteobacteria bacterium]|jgi:3-deoxy-7-phosphoheptulonate synthase|nr:3-deoxy-7-phosphoheptulonate synthase [Deltaproteobacteria bacterium]
MHEPLHDRNLESLHRLTSPAALRSSLPVPDRVASGVLGARDALRDVLHGRDRDRLVVIVGPCSLHDREASLAYAARLGAAATRLPELVVVMRTYFEKPRTTVGWKGLINDPHLDGSGDLETGMRTARSLLLEIGGLGLPCASELLDPVTPQFLADLLSWAAIGARTTESQTHREMTSGLSMPVGFKNGTEGDLQAALDAIVSAGHPHHFLGVDPDGAIAVVKTRGNPDRHVVLRGGRQGPNFHPRHVADAHERLAPLGIARGVMVDCSHDNSGKDPAQQGAVCRAVLDQVRAGQEGLMGIMLESHLSPGRQDWKTTPLAHGVSITDGCIGWEETEELLEEAAEAVRVARSRPAGARSARLSRDPSAA